MVGSFGYGNAGDEAIPLAVADLLRSAGASCELQSLSRFRDADDKSVICLGSHDQSRRDSVARLPAILAGGGIFEASAMSVHCRCYKELHRGRRRFAMIGCSAEPGSYSWMEKFRIRRSLKAAGHLYVRDCWSAEIMAKILPREKIEVIGDLVLSMQTSAAELPRRFAGIGRYLVVCLAPRWNSEPWFDWISREIGTFAGRNSLRVVFLPFSVTQDSDRVVHEIVASKLARLFPNVEIDDVDEVLSPRQLMAAISGACGVVGMRLHACVMAHAVKVPVVGISYHPKLAGFAETMGIGRWFMPYGDYQKSSHDWDHWSFRTDVFAVSDLVRLLDTMGDQTFSNLERFVHRQSEVIGKFVSSNSLGSTAF